MNRFLALSLVISSLLSIVGGPAVAEVLFGVKGNTAPASAANFMLPPQESPVIPQYIVQGPVLSVDHVYGKLSMASPNGETLQFWVSSITPIRNARGLQLQLDDIRTGDSVAIQYQTAPLSILWIEKR